MFFVQLLRDIQGCRVPLNSWCTRRCTNQWPLVTPEIHSLLPLKLANENINNKKKKPKQQLFNTKVTSIQNGIAPPAARDEAAEGSRRAGDKGHGTQHLITSASTTKTGIQKCQTPEITGKARAMETCLQWKRKKFRDIYTNRRSPWDPRGRIHEHRGTSWHCSKSTYSLRVVEAFWTGSRGLEENRRYQTARSN